MKLSEIVSQYLAHLPVGIVLEDSQVTRNLRRSVRMYCGYATLKSAPSEAEYDFSTVSTANSAKLHYE